MDLILWRHAEAVDDACGSGDLERALTAKGERQARRMAQWLHRRLARSTRILVSPALRCRQTADALGLRYRTVDALAPGADVAALLEAARWPGSTAPVLVVGHQPTLGGVAAALLCEAAPPFAVKKAAVWWIRSRERDSGAQPVLQAVQSPDWL